MRSLYLFVCVVYLSLVVDAKLAPTIEDEDELDRVGVIDDIELKLDALSSRAYRKQDSGLGHRDHAKGWAGVLNCNGVQRDGCNTFYGPSTRVHSHMKARGVSGGRRPIYHDRHGEFPHYHPAGHECIQMEVDCWKNGKTKMMWVNPHFWVRHDDVNNCPHCS